MADLASRIEITKLARELRTDEATLAFLEDRTPAELRDLRAVLSDAMFARHQDRVTRLAGLSRMLPVPLTAKIAQLALGPMLSARVAGVMDPREAAKLAGHLDPGFLAELSVSLDPTRVAGIVELLPADLVVDVGRRLLTAGEHLVLGRFVAVVDSAVALRVVDGATPADLLQVALFTEEPAALDAIVLQLDDDALAGVVRAAADAEAYDAAVGLLASLSPEACARLVAQVGVIGEESCDGLVAAVAKHDVWPKILPALHLVDQADLATLVNVPSTLDPALADRVVDHSRALDQGSSLVHVVLAFDDDHLAALKGSERLADAEVQEWLLEHAGVSRRLVNAVLVELGVRES